jgi:hypothetical protein
MSLFLANPWGLLALAAIPALLGIHALQQRSRRVRTSTLFLIEHAGRPPEGGLRLEWVRRSVPLLMQISASLALAWLLAEPQFVGRQSRQTVAVVLDASASMEAFRSPARQALGRSLRRLAGAAQNTDWRLLTTGPRQAPLYAGSDLDGLLAAVERWQPVLGTHDPTPALATAAGLTPGGRGMVVLVTDRPADVPGSVGVLAVGTPIDNVGFAGGDVVVEGDDARWRVVVTNPGERGQERTLRIRPSGAGASAGGAAGEAIAVRLEPGQTRMLEGGWPPGTDTLLFDLAPDAFTFDDSLALVRPRPRLVRVAIRFPGPTGGVIGRMLAAAPGVEIVADGGAADGIAGAGGTADIVVAPLGTPVDGAAVLIPDVGAEGDAAGPAPLDSSPVAAEDDPLVNDLGWGGLLSGAPVPLDDDPTDRPLLWKGPQPLALVRATRRPDGTAPESLLLAWDIAGSTAGRLPALVVLLTRFVERVRAGIDRPWAGNFLVDEAIAMPSAAGDRLTAVPLATAASGTVSLVPYRGRAPARPAVFAVGPPGAEPRLRGATQAADARESDFRAATTLDTLEGLRHEARVKQAIADPWVPAWLALVAVALAIAWGWPAWRSARARSPSTTA